MCPDWRMDWRVTSQFGRRLLQGYWKKMLVVRLRREKWKTVNRFRRYEEELRGLSNLLDRWNEDGEIQKGKDHRR